MQHSTTITKILENIDRDIAEEVDNPALRSPANRDYSMNMIRAGDPGRVLVSFIEQEGYMILRVSIDDKVTDMVLNSDQIKLLLRQAALWLTR